MSILLNVCIITVMVDSNRSVSELLYRNNYYHYVHVS